MQVEAEKKRMVYYFPEKGTCAKKHLWSEARFPVMEARIDDEWELVCCLVPEYYMKNRSWDKEKLLETMNHILTGQEYHSYYLPPGLADKIGIEEKFPPEILLEKVLAGVPCWECLFYIGSRENTDQEEPYMLRRLLERYLPRINHFTLITDRIMDYEDFTQDIYDEYGIPTAYMERLEKRCSRAGRTVILDGRRSHTIPCSIVPSEAVYVDLWSVEQKKKTLEKMRRDVSYMSVVKFLDTIVKNGYNTIVN